MGWLILVCSCLVQDPDHSAIVERVRPSIVAVRSMATLGERSGTGVFLDTKGLILTSYWVVPPGATDVRVWTSRPRRYRAEILAHSRRDELTLIRIRPKGATRPIPLGESANVKIGDVTYAIGNSHNCLINDTQPALTFGILSGFYNLRETRSTGFYTGWVFESTAAVHEHMEGAPLLDARGRMIGLVTLNYSPHRFLTNAIPIDYLKPRIEELKKEIRARAGPIEGPAGRGYLGFTVRQEKDRVLIDRVDPEGPAASRGLRPGDRIVRFRGRRIHSVKEFQKAAEGLEAGAVVWMTVDAGGFTAEVKIRLSEPPKRKE